jgi:hypothetical protein
VATLFLATKARRHKETTKNWKQKLSEPWCLGDLVAILFFGRKGMKTQRNYKELEAKTQ